MDVFDSNIWVYGLTRTCDDAVELVEKAVENAYHVGVDAYIFDEVMRNLDRSKHDQQKIDRAKTRFAEIVYGSHTVHGPSQEEISRMDLDAVRQNPHSQAIAQAFGIQAKDAPVLVFAFQCAQRQDAPTTVLYTADRPFSRFDPSNYFQKIVMHYVDCSG